MLTILKEPKDLTVEQAMAMKDDPNLLVFVGLCQKVLNDSDFHLAHWYFEDKVSEFDFSLHTNRLVKVRGGRHYPSDFDWYILNLSDMEKECEELVKAYEETQTGLLREGDRIVRRNSSGGTVSFRSGYLTIASRPISEYTLVGVVFRHPHNRGYDFVKEGQEFPDE